LADRHREIIRVEQDRRQRKGPDIVDRTADLVETSGRELDPIILRADIAAVTRRSARRSGRL